MTKEEYLLAVKKKEELELKQELRLDEEHFNRICRYIESGCSSLYLGYESAYTRIKDRLNSNFDFLTFEYDIKTGGLSWKVKD